MLDINTVADWVDRKFPYFDHHKSKTCVTVVTKSRKISICPMTGEVMWSRRGDIGPVRTIALGISEPESFKRLEALINAC